MSRAQRRRTDVRRRNIPLGQRAARYGGAVIDVAALTAIDVHVHTERTRSGHDPMPPELRAASARYFGSAGELPTVDDVAAYYRERRIAAVVFTVDWEARSGIPPIPNEEIADGAAANADVLIPFASVDPGRRDAVERARRLIDDHGVRGFKFHPNLQEFFPDDRAAYPLYEVIAEAGLPALFHSGHSGIGTGLPGGGGLRLKYSNPMCLDDVAADFPDLQVVLAHPSFPWQDEAISVCLHKTNVWIDLRAGRRSTSRRSSSSTRTPCCGRRSSSAPTSRSSPRTAGFPTSSRPPSARRSGP